MSADLSHYDCVCVGSSPLMILEALHQDRRGRRTLLIDAADQLGGAWRECQILGLSRTEIAPHVLTFDRKTYHYLRTSLSVPLPVVAPPPRLLVSTRWGSLWLPHALLPLLTYVSVPWHCVRHPHHLTDMRYVRNEYLTRIGEATRELLHWLLPGHQPRLRYPAGGTIELLDRLKERLGQSGVEVRLSTRLESLEAVGDQGVRMTLDTGEVTTSQACLTHHQRFRQVTAGSQCEAMKYDESHVHALHLLVATGQTSRSAFVAVKRDPLLYFISDLTSCTPDVPAGHRLIVIRLQNWRKPSTEQSAQELLTHLVRHGYLAADSRLTSFHFSSYQQGRLSSCSVAAIQRLLGESVTVFRSTNFTACLSAQIDRWTTSERHVEPVLNCP